MIANYRKRKTYNLWYQLMPYHAIVAIVAPSYSFSRPECICAFMKKSPVAQVKPFFQFIKAKNNLLAIFNVLHLNQQIWTVKVCYIEALHWFNVIVSSNSGLSNPTNSNKIIDFCITNWANDQQYFFFFIWFSNSQSFR